MTLAAERELERLVERGPLEGAFFFHGQAARLRDDGARRLIDAALDPSTRDFNMDLFHGDDVSAEDLAAAIAMPPMMAERRVVGVLGAEGLGKKARDVLVDAVEDLPAGLTLVVTATIPDRSKASFYKTLKKSARELSWSAPSEDEVPGWLMERAEAVHGFELGKDAAQALATAVGAFPDELDAELAKLASSAEEGRIDVELVRRLVPNVRAVGRWDWLDRVAERAYGAALSDLPRLLSESSESAVGLLIGMVDQHLYIGVAVEGGQGAVSRALQDAGKPYLKWKARIYASQARRWTAPEVERAVGLMRRADRHVKSGIPDRRAMEELLLGLGLLQREAGGT
ncbi:MAG TPA: DNA polymerase III subunit delta [Gemmatimonadota bacterium]|nr:DNA polymerase III subunit delta [Gemmatimonadota bacterium]